MLMMARGGRDFDTLSDTNGTFPKWMCQHLPILLPNQKHQSCEEKTKAVKHAGKISALEGRSRFPSKPAVGSWESPRVSEVQLPGHTVMGVGG